MATFFDPLKNILFSAHKGSTVGVDIGSSSIKVVELERMDEIVVLKNYGEIILGPRADVSAGQATNLPPEKIAQAIQDLLHEAGITAKHSVVAIPCSASLLSVIELPDVGEKEFASMVPLEARRYIPVPVSEVSLDWWVLPQSEERKGATPPPGENASIAKEVSAVPAGKVDVIVAAIHNDVIKKYETISREAHLPGEASHFEIEIFSTLRAVVGSETEPVLVMDIGAGSTKLALADKGVLRGSHIVSTGAQEITSALARSQNMSFDDAERMKCESGLLGDEGGRDVAAVADIILSGILSEAVRFVENYEHKNSCVVQKVILSGGGASLKGLDTVVKKHFPKMSVVVTEPFERAKSQAFLSRTLKEIGPRFAVAVGLALKGLEE